MFYQRGNGVESKISIFYGIIEFSRVDSVEVGKSDGVVAWLLGLKRCGASRMEAFETSRGRNYAFVDRVWHNM